MICEGHLKVVNPAITDPKLSQIHGVLSCFSGLPHDKKRQALCIRTRHHIHLCDRQVEASLVVGDATIGDPWPVPKVLSVAAE